MLIEIIQQIKREAIFWSCMTLRGSTKKDLGVVCVEGHEAGGKADRFEKPSEDSSSYVTKLEDLLYI